MSQILNYRPPMEEPGGWAEIMTAEEQYKIADLRARLAGLRMLLDARTLWMKTDGAACQLRDEDPTQPVRAEIAKVKMQLEGLGVSASLPP